MNVLKNLRTFLYSNVSIIFVFSQGGRHSGGSKRKSVSHQVQQASAGKIRQMVRKVFD